MKNYKVSPFTIDITPPVGHPIAFCINEKVDSRIFIRGVVIDDSITRIVIASADVLYFIFSAYDKMVTAIAEAAGTKNEHVFLTAIHQHDSVAMINPDETDCGIGQKLTPEYWNKCLKDTTTGIKKAITDGFIEVQALAVSKTKITGLASNRRTYNDDGSIAMRYSMCSDTELKKRPEGVFDPYLRTIAFLGTDEQVICALHYYASHPMAAYMRNMVSADVPGVALNYVGKRLGNDNNIFINGCGGNVTFGKYGFHNKERNFESKEKSLNHLGKILGKAIATNIRNLRTVPFGNINIRSERIELPLRKGVTVDSLAVIAENTKIEFDRKIALRWKKTVQEWDKYGFREIRTISFGNEITILELFAEMAVEYQLYANSLVPDKFLAVAAYNEASCAYTCTAKMYEEGGYEPTTNYLSPEIEVKLKATIKKLLTENRE